MEEVPELVSVPEPKSIPVIIITGFLGAGKSTLIRNLLSEKHGKRIAVIMNEIGPSSGVDKAILYDKEQQLSEEWLEIENGCLCCTAKNDVFLAIESLVIRRPDVDLIVIETSGAADPSALVQKLWVDEALQSKLYFDGCICVYDPVLTLGLSKNLDDYYQDAARQIALADLIIVNKAEDDTDPEATRSVLTLINPTAKIAHTVYSNIKLEKLLNVGHYRGTDAESISALLQRFDHIDAPNHMLSTSVRSFTLRRTSLESLDIFEKWLYTLLWERVAGSQILNPADSLLRIKGLLSIRPGQTIALQAVRNIYDLDEIHHTQRSESCLIFIGQFSKESEESVTSSFYSLP